MALLTSLEAYWKLDESSGDAADSSGNGHTLTNVGSITYEAGKINNGARNNSGSKRLSATINGLTLASNNTWAFWYKPNAHNGYLMDHFTQSGSRRAIFYNDGNGIRLFASGNEIDGGAMTLGTEYFVVAVKTGSSWELFVDNVSKGTTTTGAVSYSNTSAFSLLSPADSFVAQPNAVIDEFGYWTQALDATDRSDLFNGGAGLSHPFSVAALPTPSNFLMMGV